jgi:rhodanese-related sulfurtransferase
MKKEFIPQGHSVQSPLEGDKVRMSRQAAQLSFIILSAVLTAFLGLTANGQAANSHKSILDLCCSCHQEEPGVTIGFLENISLESREMELDIISRPEIIKFNDETSLHNIPSFADLANYRKSGLKVKFSETNQEKLATEIIKLDLLLTLSPTEKLAKDVLKKIITNPNVRTYEVKSPTESMLGHLPGAMPIPALFFDKAIADLPADKEAPLVLYGTRDYLLHATFTKIKSLGYQDVRIYLGGYSDWTSTDYLMIDSNWLKNAIEAGTPHVLIDLRPTENLISGHIKGAVSIPANDLDKYRKQLPWPKDTPIIFYGPGDRQAAAKVISWGYRAVGVIPSSFDGWQSIGNPVDPGPATPMGNFGQKAGPAPVSFN